MAVIAWGAKTGADTNAGLSVRIALLLLYTAPLARDHLNDQITQLPLDVE